MYTIPYELKYSYFSMASYGFMLPLTGDSEQQSCLLFIWQREGAHPG